MPCERPFTSTVCVPGMAPNGTVNTIAALPLNVPSTFADVNPKFVCVLSQ